MSKLKWKHIYIGIGRRVHFQEEDRDGAISMQWAQYEKELTFSQLRPVNEPISILLYARQHIDKPAWFGYVHCALKIWYGVIVKVRCLNGASIGTSNQRAHG